MLREGRWGIEDVRAYNAVYARILKMSGALPDGIIKQFPKKFVMSPTVR